MGTCSSPTTTPPGSRPGRRCHSRRSPRIVPGRARARGVTAGCTPFQRDRDRIVHSKAFRRLKHKTQVFVAPEGDHYRTRLTHTLEATQISRTVARALRLNEDLTEAIGLGHDVGHPPFGHIGEACWTRRPRALRPRLPPQRALAPGGRRARGQPHGGGARRDPAPLERRRRAGDARGQDRPAGGPDRLHQPRHRRRAARRRAEPEALPAEEIAILGETGSARIDTAGARPRHSERAGDIVQGDEVGGAMLRLRTFMFEHVYLGPTARAEHAKIERVLRGLFDWYCSHPEELPPALARRPGDRLAGGDDRPLRDPRLGERFVPQGLAVWWPLHAGLARAGPRRGRLRGAGRRPHRAQAVGRAAAVRACARSTTSGRRRSGSTRREALPLLRLRRGRRRLLVRDGDRGARLRGALESLADRYGVQLEREAEDPATRRAALRATGCWRCSSAPPRTTCACCGSRPRRPPRARTSLRGAGGGALREFRVGFAGLSLTTASSARHAGGYSGDCWRAGWRWSGATAAWRPLPRADHVPALRRARPGARVRARALRPTTGRST